MVGLFIIILYLHLLFPWLSAPPQQLHSSADPTASGTSSPGFRKRGSRHGGVQAGYSCSWRQRALQGHLQLQLACDQKLGEPVLPQGLGCLVLGAVVVHPGDAGSEELGVTEQAEGRRSHGLQQHEDENTRTEAGTRAKDTLLDTSDGPVPLLGGRGRAVPAVPPKLQHGGWAAACQPCASAQVGGSEPFVVVVVLGVGVGVWEGQGVVGRAC